jgi:hypothetical protein
MSYVTTPNTQVTQVSQHVPYVPAYVDSALIQAKPLACSLAASSPGLRNLRKVKFAKLQPIERNILRDCESKAAAARAFINIHLSKIDQLFSAVATSIKLASKHVDYIFLADWNPSKTVLATRVEQLSELSEDAYSQVKKILLELGLDSSLLVMNGTIHPAAIFEACVSHIKCLQTEWQKAYFEAIDQALNVQNFYLRGAATDCLGQICKFALSNTLELDSPPESQEAVFNSLKDSLRNPLSGDWPKTVTVVETASSVNKTKEGGAA